MKFFFFGLKNMLRMGKERSLRNPSSMVSVHDMCTCKYSFIAGYRPNDCVPLNLYVGILTSNMVILGGGTFGNYLVVRMEPSRMGLVPL